MSDDIVKIVQVSKKIVNNQTSNYLIINDLGSLSGYQDSNLGPPAPKAGALTGLRYTPNAVFLKKRCKVTTFFCTYKTLAQKKSENSSFFMKNSFFAR